MRTIASSLAGPLTVIFTLGSVLVPRVSAQCSEHDITAVVLFDSLGPEPTLRRPRLHITPVLQVTNPSDAELLAAIDSVFEHDPLYAFRRVATAGDYFFYASSPRDFGAAAVVDSRSGDVVFAGTVVWAGRGSLRIPGSAMQVISVSPALPAAPPSQVETFPDFAWYWEWPEPQQLTENTVQFLRQTDLLRAFATCGNYTVVGFTYTPAIGKIDPEVASQVIIVSGRSTPPWATSAVERTSWSEIKAHYR